MMINRINLKQINSTTLLKKLLTV